MGKLLLQLGELVEVAPDRLLAAGILRWVIPLVGLATDAFIGPKPLVDGSITVKERHLAFGLEIGKGIDQAVDLVAWHVSQLVITAVDAPLGEVGRDDAVVAGDRQVAGGHIDHRITTGVAARIPTGVAPGIGRRVGRWCFVCRISTRVSSRISSWIHARVTNRIGHAVVHWISARARIHRHITVVMTVMSTVRIVAARACLMAVGDLAIRSERCEQVCTG